MDYKKYLNSKHWKKTREFLFKEKGKYCHFCFSSKNINVHHKYYRFYKEKNNHLVPLCRSCHTTWHSWHGRRKLLGQYIVRANNLTHLGAPVKEAIRFCSHKGAYRILLKHYRQKRHYGREHVRRFEVSPTV